MFDSIIFLFVFSIIYILIIEIFTVLFRLTGLPEEKARFQVISLLTACGFTTSQSEAVTVSRQRRRLASLTIVFGYIFSLIIVSVVVNVFLDMSGSEVNSFLGIGLTFTSMFLMIFVLVKSRKIKKYTDALIMHLTRDDNNSVIVMDILNDRIIANVHLSAVPEFLEGKALKDSGLKLNHNIQVLVISRNGKALDSIDADTQFMVNDDIVLFGNEREIMNIFRH